jgi:ribosomal protein L37E
MVVKNGHRADGKQTYKCSECGYRFATQRITTDAIKQKAVVLYCAGLSFRTIGALLGYANTAILYWVREFAQAHYHKPIPKGEIVLELDEMWHFLQSKKTNCGFGKRIAEQLDSLLTGNAGIEIPELLRGCIIG